MEHWLKIFFKMIRGKINFTIALLFFSIYSTGQSLDFSRITTMDGLHNGTINAISTHSDGSVWFSTWDGLIRYDGYNFKTYLPILDDSTSIPAKQCQNSFLDSNDELWISTRNGIAKYNKEYDNFSRFQLPRIDINLRIQFYFTEFNDYLFVGSFNGVFYHSLNSGSDSNNTSEFKELKILGMDGGQISSGVRNFEHLSDKFIFTNRGRDEEGKLQTKVSFARPENISDSIFHLRVYKEIIITGLVNDVHEKDGAIIYFATNRGVIEYNSNTQSQEYLKRLRQIKVNTLLIDSNNDLWIGTRQSGLIKYDKEGMISRFTYNPKIQNSLISNNILSIAEDFSGNLWVGTDGQGLSVLNLLDKGFTTYRYDPSNPVSLKSNTVFCFSESEDEILIGTKEEGLFLIKNEDLEDNASFKSIIIPEFETEEKSNKSVWDIQKEGENIYWLATSYGLIRGEISNKKWDFKRYLSDEKTGIIRKIFVDENYNLWVGSYNGLYLLPVDSRDQGKFYHLTNKKNDVSSLSDNVITSFLLDTEDNFWIGTQSGGVNKLVKKYSSLSYDSLGISEISFNRYIASADPKSWIKANEINCLFEFYDGSIWAGTQGAGINILHPGTKHVESFSNEADKIGIDVFGIISAPEGNLWISTNNGLSRYDQIDRKFTNFSPSDGIQGNVFMVNSYFIASDNYLYFGGRNGFTRFNPGTINQNLVSPKIFLTDFQIYQKSVEIGEEVNGNIILEKAVNYTNKIVLSYKDSDLSIHFAAIHYENPSENMVEYMLEGFDNEFARIQAKQGFVRYTNLNPGDYNLRMRAGNSDDVWMDYYKELEIIVLPPWWLTIFAKLMFLMLTILVFSGITYLLLHRERLRHSLTIEKMEKETLKELNESKLRFFTNISHEFRTPLTLILGPLEASLEKIKDKDYFIAKQLKTAIRNSDILLRLVNQIIDFRQLAAGKLSLRVERKDIGKFILEIISSFDSMREEKNINLDVTVPENSIKIYFDPAKLEQIMYNLLSNAIKYTYNEGNIMISCELKNMDISHKGISQEYFCIHVFNDGKEIPEDKQEKIFERFYTLSESSIGSGIGLGLTKSLVELHMGHLSLDSGIGKGNTFSVFIPTNLHTVKISKKDEELQNIPGNKAILSEFNDSNDNPELEDSGSDRPRLLFIDDNSELRSFFKSSLSDQFLVNDAENGREGVNITNEIVPDIIVCDIAMPEMDGIEFCKVVKESEATSHIPIILLTAKDSPDFKISGYKAGADGYVVKPFRIDVLKAHIEQLLTNRDKIRENYQSSNYVILGKDDKVLSKDDKFLNKVKEIIEENILNSDFNVSKLAENLNIGTTQLYRKIKALTGHTSVEFVNVLRLVKAAELLETQDYSIKEVSYMTGFNSPSYFVKCFREKYNITPVNYQKNRVKG